MDVYQELLAACKRAVLRSMPILYIRTNEIEVIQWLLAHMRDVALVPPLKEGTQCAQDGMVYEDFNWDTDSEMPVNYVPFRGSAVSPPEIPSLYLLHISPQMPCLQYSEYLYQFCEAYLSEKNEYAPLRLSFVLIYGGRVDLPECIQPYTETLEVELPRGAEIKKIIADTVQEYGQTLSVEQADHLQSNLMGFTRAKGEHMLRGILNAQNIDGKNAIHSIPYTSRVIQETKAQVLKQGGVLDLIQTDRNLALNQIGGMDSLLRWLKESVEPRLKKPQRYLSEMGVRAPKGTLLCGVPGCGKSLAAKATAKHLKLPLLRIEIGKLMGKYQGESEHNMALALRQTEAMSPCVLWIDELDKGFAGAKGGGEDSASFMRMFGAMLTWMEENTAPCFLFATANNLNGLPPEFFRSGRFDELFAVMLPNRRECAEIFRIQMKTAAQIVKEESGRELFEEACLETSALEKMVDKYFTGRPLTGADIEKITQFALVSLFPKRQAPIRLYDWEGVTRKVSAECSVYGDGAGRMDTAALCMLYLLKNRFKAVSERPLFLPAQYECGLDENGRPYGKINGRDKEKTLGGYDLALYTDLLSRIGRLAPLSEQAETHRVLRG